MLPVGRVTIVVAVAAIFLTLPTKSEAGFTDRLFSAFFSAGRAFANATQNAMGGVKRFFGGFRGSGSKDSYSDIFSTVCNDKNKNYIIACLHMNEDPVVRSDWSSCIGPAKTEVQTKDDLFHWVCSQMTSKENKPSDIENLSTITECLLDGLDKSDVYGTVKECKNNRSRGRG